MIYILLCRIFLIIPCWIILLLITTIVIVRYLKSKNKSLKNNLLSLSLALITVLTSYFMFVHGNVRKTTLDIDNCINSFDEILALDMEKQEEPYLFSKSGDYYYTKKLFNNVQAQIHVIYGKMDSSFDIIDTQKNSFEYMGKYLFSKSKRINNTNCTVSAMYAGKEELFGVHAFNGSYSGSIYMQRGDINIIIDYTISDDLSLLYAFTTVKPRKG